MAVTVLPLDESMIESLHACLDRVSNEMKYMISGMAQSLEVTRSLLLRNLQADQPLYAAIEDGRVVGWCEITRPSVSAFEHTACLGMGLYEEYRGQGIGARLLRAALAKAFADGIERIELTVFDANRRAISLYEKNGFVREGAMRKKVKLNGQYHDLVFMALLRADAPQQFLG